MKKYTKVLALALAMMMLMSMSAFAADFEVTGETGVTVTPDAEKPKFDLSIDAEDGMYLLLVLNGTDEIPTASNILYVNQATASDGKVIFENVYPKSIANSTIYLAGGGAGLTEIGAIAKLGIEGVLGDVDFDEEVTIFDVDLLFRHVNEQIVLSSEALSVADVDYDEDVSIFDVDKLFRYVNEQIPEL